MYRVKPNGTFELRKVFLWAMTGPALHFLCITHIKILSKKSDVSSSLRGLTTLMSVELLPDSAKPEPEKPIHENEVANVRRYPIRDRVRPKYLDDYITGKDLDNVVDDAAKCTIDVCYRLTNASQSYQDAISYPDSSKWNDAMDEEFYALWENETFELTSLPDGRTSVGGEWVYVIKPGPNGEEKYKARFVAKGSSQVPRVDHYETFSPTAHMTLVRMLMSKLFKRVW